MKDRKIVNYFKTTFPENINNYLKHRNLDADAILGIFKVKKGGYYYVFYKEPKFKDKS